MRMANAIIPALALVFVELSLGCGPKASERPKTARSIDSTSVEGAITLIEHAIRERNERLLSTYVDIYKVGYGYLEYTVLANANENFEKIQKKKSPSIDDLYTMTHLLDILQAPGRLVTPAAKDFESKTLIAVRSGLMDKQFTVERFYDWEGFGLAHDALLDSRYLGIQASETGLKSGKVTVAFQYADSSAGIDTTVVLALALERNLIGFRVVKLENPGELQDFSTGWLGWYGESIPFLVEKIHGSDC